MDTSDGVLAFLCTVLQAIAQSACVVIAISINDVSFLEQKTESLKGREKSKDVHNDKITC